MSVDTYVSSCWRHVFVPRGTLTPADEEINSLSSCGHKLPFLPRESSPPVCCIGCESDLKCALPFVCLNVDLGLSCSTNPVFGQSVCACLTSSALPSICPPPGRLPSTSDQTFVIVAHSSTSTGICV